MDNASHKAWAADQSILLLHCSASSGRQWDRLAGLLGGGFRPVAPDLYGYGDTASWTGPGGLSLAAEAALAASALPGDTDAVHVVGHSYGGAVALRFAVEQPWRVKSLTLIEPVAFHTLREGGTGDRRLLDSVQRVAAAVVKGTITGDYHDAMSRFVDYWSGAGAWTRTKPETRRRTHAAINAPGTGERGDRRPHRGFAGRRRAPGRLRGCPAFRAQARPAALPSRAYGPFLLLLPARLGHNDSSASRPACGGRRTPAFAYRLTTTS